MQKFLLVNAIDPDYEVERSLPPLGLAYLAAVLRKRFGQEAFEFRIRNAPDIEKEIEDFNPSIVGISSVTQNFNKAKAYAKKAKARGLTVVMGGIHITELPSTLTEDMDVGVVGEGEGTIVDLMDVFLRDGKFSPGALKDIPGLVYRDGDGNIAQSAEREWIQTLDDIPFPSRDLLTIDSHTYLFTMRGCPFRCSFCASTRFWNKLRAFTPEYIVREIKLLVEEHGVKSIHFFDDIFVANRNQKTITELTGLLKRENLLGKVSYSCAARANLITEDLVHTLRDFGIASIGMGLESGNAEALKYLKGTNISLEQSRKAVEIIHDSGLEVGGSFIFGCPQETKEQIQETLDFAKTLPLDGVQGYVLMPLPGTPVWFEAKEKGLVSDDMDWDRLSIHYEDHYQKVVQMSEVCSPETLRGFIGQFRDLQRYKKGEAMVKLGLRHPEKIPGYLLKKGKQVIRSVLAHGQ